MKTSRRSHLLALFSAIAAFFGLTRKASCTNPSLRATAEGPPPASPDPRVVNSPDGITRFHYDASGRLIREDRFDGSGRLARTVTYSMGS